MNNKIKESINNWNIGVKAYIIRNRNSKVIRRSRGPIPDDFQGIINWFERIGEKVDWTRADVYYFDEDGDCILFSGDIREWMDMKKNNGDGLIRLKIEDYLKTDEEN